MHSVLMAAYIFPPVATTGVHRTLKFVKHLPACGWRPCVLTTANSAYEGRDESLLRDLPPELCLTKVASLESAAMQRTVRRLGRLMHASPRVMAGLDWRVERLMSPLGIPDRHMPWALTAAAAGLWLVLRRGIGVLYTTSWPYSDHVAGLILHRITGLPWVADFRDPWLSNANYRRDPRTRLGRLERWFEAKFVTRASAVLATTDAVTDDFRRRYPHLDAAKFHTIYNGYDPGDLPSLPAPPAEGPLRLAHVGAFYAARTPRPLLEALASLARQGVTPRELQFTFIGRMDAHQGEIERLGVAAFIECLGQRPLAECYSLTASSHALCMVTAGEHGYTVPGKMYEYLASDKPILALVPPQSEPHRLLAPAGGVAFASPDDPAAIASAIAEMLDRHRRGTLRCDRDRAYVEQFSRQRQTQRLAAIFDRLLQTRGLP